METKSHIKDQTLELLDSYRLAITNGNLEPTEDDVLNLKRVFLEEDDVEYGKILTYLFRGWIMSEGVLNG